jgi:hypothetical protein
MAARRWFCVVVMVAAGLAAGPAVGSAGAATCKVGRPTVVQGEFNAQKNEHDSTVMVDRGGRLRSAVEYRATEPSVVKWLRSRAHVTAGTFVSMSCFGFAVGDPANNPALYVLQGTATVHDRGSRPLGVLTIEALVGPAPQQQGQRLNFTTGEHYGKHTPSTTRVGTLRHTPYINVTPYVGPEPGTCRHAISATLISSRGEGKAIYKLAG